MKLTGPQIDAAMTLAGMTRDSLSKGAGISKKTLQDTVNGIVYRDATVNKIREVLELHGIEFLPNEGLRRKPVAMDILTGREGLQKFFDTVHEYASANGGTIVMFGIDETTFIETITPEFSQNYLKRMTEVSKKRGDLKVLSIVCEGDTNFCASDYNEYRWISKSIFQAVPFYIFGETLAIMDFDTAPGPTIMLIKSKPITNGYRKQFQAFWDMASPPPPPDKKGGKS